jgi:hypothetical protein
MKTRHIIRISIGTFAIGVFALAARAGPGPQYWRDQANAGNKAAVSPPSAERAFRGCGDARLVTITETKSSWTNGRGPMLTTTVGQKLMCTACDTPAIVMKPSGHNGRGAMVPVEIKGKHDCSKNGCGAAVATANSTPSDCGAMR